MIARAAPAPVVARREETRFAVQLATATPRAELLAWFDGAAAGARAIYATGALLPQGAPGVVLARELEEAGRAHLLQERDRIDPRRFNYIIQKRASPGGPTATLLEGGVSPLLRRPKGPGGPSHFAARATLPPDMPKLLAVLRALPRDGEGWAACPSNAALARQLGRGGSGRGRAKYLLALAQRHGLLAIESHGRNAPRRVKLMEVES